MLGPELKQKPVIVSTRKADSLLLFPTSEEKAQKEAEVAEASKASLRLASLETQRLRGWWEKNPRFGWKSWIGKNVAGKLSGGGTGLCS